jgi:hypothetical protein
MSEIVLASAHRIIVPGRAGELIIQRKSWPVTVETDGDTILIGYLPANCKINVGLSQVIFEAAVKTCDVDVCIDTASNVLHNSGTHTESTLTRAAFSTHELGETLGVSTNNRAILLLLNSKPGSAVGSIHVDLAYNAV